MSGTSMDGVSAAVVDLAGDTIQLVASSTTSYPNTLRADLQTLVDPDWRGSLKDIQALDLDVAGFYVECSQALLSEHKLEPGDLVAVGSHGQTVCHTPLGEHRSSWQIGDPNLIAEYLGTTIADWRRRDMAAGGQGAPLTPAFHRHILNQQQQAAIVNFGGIANLTICNEQWLGFDPGPANILLDNWIEKHHAKPFDDLGNWARQGTIHQELLGSFLSDPYFDLDPPKSTGREYFNLAWLDNKLYDTSIPARDVQATLTELTAVTVLNAIERYAPETEQLYVCGGGVHNDYLMSRLKTKNKLKVDTTSALKVDPDYVEAIAFAWLAKCTLEKRAGNIPEATGASGDRIIGAVYYQ